MATYPLVLSNKSAPQFQPTLDGSQYLVQVIWNLFGQRYYVRCSTLQGALVFNLPLIESPDGVSIETLAWNILSGQVEGVTTDPHGYPVGSTVALTILGATPTVYNTQALVFITGDDSFEYPLELDSDPGPSTIGGVLRYDISMTAGYFSSTLTYRNGSFDVEP